METKILPPDELGLAEATRLLRKGALVAFPTETVYGLGGLASHQEAVQAIFTAKGRPSTDPLIVHLPEPDLSRAVQDGWVAEPLPNSAVLLTQTFWPGPLTLILRRGPRATSQMTAGLETVAVRCPSHPVAQRLLHAIGAPLAAPSANRFGRISPTDADAVRQELGGAIPLILDGGPCTIGLESTVVDLSSPCPEILRPGAITPAQISDVLGQKPKIRSGFAKTETAQTAPGQQISHYAPRTPLYVCDQPVPHFERDNFYLLFQICPQPLPGNALCLAADQQPETAARELYRFLRCADASGACRILVEPVPAGPWHDALQDRLARASTGLATWNGQGWQFVPRPGV